MISEEEFINDFLKALTANNQAALNLTDDAAILSLEPSEQLVISKDILLAGQHFFENDPPLDIAYKAIAVNISDIIAKGAVPFAYMLGLAIPKTMTKEWVTEFTTGLAETQKQFGILLLGGDTTGTKGPLNISITIFGKCKKNAMIARSTAKPGHQIYTTGTLGDSALGYKLISDPNLLSLDILDDKSQFYLKNRYLRPKPPIAINHLLSKFASSAMDLSDGLVSDLEKLCKASNCGAKIELEKIPLSHPAKKIISYNQEIKTEILAWGDDYQILFTVAPENEKPLNKIAKQEGIDIKNIGIILSDNSIISFLDKQGERVEFKDKTFQHF